MERKEERERYKEAGSVILGTRKEVNSHQAMASAIGTHVRSKLEGE